ncbi:MAG: acyl carrier protein [Planctomycetes bacterium]|nr:acyl carrier protein [Planctomycetota bacterium]
MPLTDELRAQIKEMLVRRLRLKVDPAAIADDQPLFGDGLGLDSIDVLEVVAGLEKEFGAAIKTQEEGERILRSVNAIAAYLVEKGSPRKA